MEILNYFAKVGLYWTLFYLCYWLLLSRHTFFQWNRFYLIGALTISLFLPLITYPEMAPDVPVIYQATARATTIYYRPKPVTDTFTWKELLAFIYVSGALISLAGFAVKVRSLLSFIRNKEMIELENCTLVLIDTDEIGSFSFLKWIVINKSDYEHNLDPILRHEMVHIQQLHSLDILLLELLKIIFWFNPLLILYTRSLQEIHEFLADDQAPDKGYYAQFLLSYALNAPSVTLTNHFYNSSQIKNRIKMIYKNRSAKRFRWYYFASVCVLLMALVLVTGCERFKKRDKTEQAQTNMTVDGHVINADTKLAIPGANIVVMNMQRGTTTDRDGHFAIDAPGTAKLEISFSGFENQIRELDQVANHLIALRPVKLSDTVALQDVPSFRKQAVNPNTLQASDILYRQSDPPLVIQAPGEERKSNPADDPLLVVDGKINDSPDFWSTLLPESIARLEVLSGKSAGEKYGRKEKDSVILVQTKNP